MDAKHSHNALAYHAEHSYLNMNRFKEAQKDLQITERISSKDEENHKHWAM
ncbi:MAG: hypothetical protein AAF806_05870 [Bacteroidota bacterium]